MIEDVISFSIKNSIFATDFKKVPIILKADKYLIKGKIINSITSFYYENGFVDLINLSSFFSIDPLHVISDSSKILVGYHDTKMFGILVDKVNDYFNFKNNSIIIKSDFKDSNSFLLGKVKIDSEELLLIDLEKILNATFIKII